MFEPTAEDTEILAHSESVLNRIFGDAHQLKEHDEKEFFDPTIMQSLGEEGLCGITTSEAHGGFGRGYYTYALVLEAIAKRSASYAVSVAVNGLPQMILQHYGNDAQRSEWMEPLATGGALGAFALSEPESGSDAASLQTTAVREGSEYVLNGRKFWITHGGYADVYVVMARTGQAGPKGISAFLVPKSTPGLSFGKKEEKMGLRASPTVELLLDNARIPAENLLQAEGRGFQVAMSALDSGRITIGAIGVGLAQSALEQATEYACVRKQFNKPIIDFQGVGFMLADMAIQIESARLLVHKAAALKDAGKPYSLNAAMAKCAATDTAMKVTTDAVQVLGGYGYTREYPLERYMRDAKVMQIVEGTNQIQRYVISKQLKQKHL
ncbi:MAG: acyl-CoA dehydrogenase family protein [Myxococcota bacterium]